MPEKLKKTLGRGMPYLIGTFKGFVVFTLLLCLTTLLLYKTHSDSPVFYYSIFIFIVAGAFVCAISVYKKVGGRGFLTGIISCIPYTIVIFLCFSIIIGFNISPNIFLVFILTIAGGFLGGVTAANTKI